MVGKQWKSSLFNCFSDCGLCCIVTCCTNITTGQLSTMAFGGSRWKCVAISLLLSILLVVSFVMMLIGGDVLLYISEGLDFISAMIIFFVVCLARSAISKRDNIEASCLETCCASWWCAPCVTCQLFSQENIGTNRGLHQWNPFTAYGADGDHPPLLPA
jgi:Cys-rich protein (TIGR01571 family)